MAWSSCSVFLGQKAKYVCLVFLSLNTIKINVEAIEQWTLRFGLLNNVETVLLKNEP